jgi:hypothetical protein
MMDKRLAELATKLRKAHDAALRSLDSYHRAGAGTRSARLHFERYERRCDEFDAAIAKLESGLASTTG